MTQEQMKRIPYNTTVTGTIVSRTLEPNQYTILYDGVQYEAFSLGNDRFNPGDSVYILVLNNTLSNKKMILGRTDLVPGVFGDPGFYGSFYDIESQSPNPLTSLIQPIKIRQTLEANGISIINGQTIKFQYAGTYSLTFSVQLTNNSNDIQKGIFWVRSNNQNYPNSGSEVDVIGRKSTGVPSRQLATVNYVASAEEGQEIELWWSATNNDLKLEYFPPTSLYPAVPSIILTIVPVSNLIVGPQGPKGDPGYGVPPGGTEGQVLAKASNSDYDVEWTSSSGTNTTYELETSGPIIEEEEINLARINLVGSDATTSSVVLQGGTNVTITESLGTITINSSGGGGGGMTYPGAGIAVSTGTSWGDSINDSSELALALLGSTTGTENLVFANSPTLVTPNLGTPSALTLTNATGLPVAGISNLGTGVGAFLITPTSANLAAAVTDETGTGLLVFATSPSLITPSLGAATATSINGTTIPTSKTLFTTDSGTLTGKLILSPGTAQPLDLVGVDHTFIQFYPQGIVAGRKAYLGFGSAGTNTLTISSTDIVNIDATNIVQLPGTKTKIGSTTLTQGGSVSVALPSSAGTLALTSDIPANIALTTGTLAQFAATTSSQLAGVISDETGSGALVFATSPSLTTPNIGVASGTALTLSGDLAVNGGDITSTATTFNLIDTNATTVNFAGAATTLTIGATTGTLRIENPTITTSVTSGTLALFNTGLTGTLNIGNAAATLSIGNAATTSTFGYTSTAASTTNISTGAVANTITKTINIGTGGASGSNTNIFIGSGTTGANTVIDIDGVGTADIIIDDSGLSAGGTAEEPAIYPSLNEYGSLGLAGARWYRLYTSRIISTPIYARTVTGTVRNLYINSGGEFGGISSSRRFKDNIEDFNGNYKSILQLEPKTFYYNLEETDKTEKQLGFIAEQAQELGLDFLYQVDDQGVPDYFAYEKLPIYLLGLAKEQQKLIEGLTARIEALENK
jgi:hypothetical protein